MAVLLQDENSRLQQVICERDEAVDAARRSEAHAAALAGARNLPPAPAGLLSAAGAREPLQPLQGAAAATALVPAAAAALEASGSEQLSRTALVHKLELTERRLREQAHEIRRMVRPRAPARVQSAAAASACALT